MNIKGSQTGIGALDEFLHIYVCDHEAGGATAGIFEDAINVLLNAQRWGS